MNRDGKNKKIYYILAAFSVVVLAVYSPTLSNGFVNYDDPLYVYENAVVKAGLTWQGLVWAFTTFRSYNWHPLTWLSHMVDVQLFGLNPAGHHLVNLLFHLANSLLLFGVLRKMTGAVWRSLAVAALFALHPLHVESVAWVAERKDVLSTFFWMLAMWVYAGYARTGKKTSYLLVALFLSLGLMAKPMLVTFPFVLLLLDWWPLWRFSAGGAATSNWKSFAYLLLEKVPFLAIALASSAVTYLVQKKGGAVLYASSFSENAGNALISYVKYLAKTVWPHPLAVLYPFDPDEITVVAVGGAALFLAVLSFLLLRQARRRPYLAVGWLWYLVTLVPVIGFVRIGQHAIADRYTYVPLIGLFIIAAWGSNELRTRFHLSRGMMASLATVVFALLALLTVRQERYWRNGVTLFEHAVAVTENNFTAHKNLGLAYGRLGNLERARSEERISRMLGYQYKVKVWPNDYEAHYNLGIAYSDLGRFADAAREYQTAITLNPNYAKAYNDLGIALVNEGKIEDAKEAFRSAMRIDPNFSAAAHNYNELEKRQNMR